MLGSTPQSAPIYTYIFYQYVFDLSTFYFDYILEDKLEECLIPEVLREISLFCHPGTADLFSTK